MYQSILAGCSSGTICTETPRNFHKRVEVGRRPGQQDPVGAELLGVGGEPGGRVPAGIDGDLHEHHLACRDPAASHVALEGDERAGDEWTLVLAQGEEVGHHDVLAAVGGERGRGARATRSAGYSGIGTVLHDALAGRRRAADRRSSRRRPAAFREATSTSQDACDDRADAAASANESRPRRHGRLELGIRARRRARGRRARPCARPCASSAGRPGSSARASACRRRPT